MTVSAGLQAGFLAFRRSAVYSRGSSRYGSEAFLTSREFFLYR